MIGIYREIQNPQHVVKVLKRDSEGISYEDGGRIVCTKRFQSFDLKFKKDETATIADIVASYN